MSDIFEEVEEGLAQDKTAALWRKYWPIVAIVCVTVIGAVAANSYFAHARAQKIEQSGKAFEDGLNALEAEKIDVARQHLSTASEFDTGFAPLAQNLLAGAELTYSGDEAAALSYLDDAASFGGPIGQVSQLKAAYIMADTASLEELEAQVRPLLAEDSTFAALARELIAAKALSEGAFDRARKEYNFLSLNIDSLDGGGVSQSITRRAQAALKIIPTLEAKMEAENASIATDEMASSPETVVEDQ